MLDFRKEFNFDIGPILAVALFVLNSTLCSITLFNKSDKILPSPTSQDVHLNQNLPADNLSKVPAIDNKVVHSDELIVVEGTENLSADNVSNESGMEIVGPFRRTGQDILTVFGLLEIRPGEKVLEIGLNSVHLGILAAIRGAQVTIVEKEEIIKDTDIRKLIDKWEPGIAAVGGNIDLIPGDILDPAMQIKLQGLVFDHVFAIDDDIDEAIVSSFLQFKSPDSGSIYINHLSQMDGVLRGFGMRPFTVSYVPKLQSKTFTKSGLAQLYQFDDRVFKKMRLVKKSLYAEVKSGEMNSLRSKSDVNRYNKSIALVLFNGAGLLGEDMAADEVGLDILRYKITSFASDEECVVIVDNAIQEKEIKRNIGKISKDIVYIRWDDDWMTDEIRYELINLLAIYEGMPLDEHILSKKQFWNVKEYLNRK